MSRTSVIAIFDIGKTNKKLFLFDEQYNIVLEKSEQFAEITDEDGDACEDLAALTKWVQACLFEVFQDKRFHVRALNFSTYGASFVHIDKEGKAAAPLYNYLKPFPADLQAGFYQKYGGELSFSIHTASPVLGNLNSGMQLYRLKYKKPELFERIHYSLHLPQYMSYLVTGRAYSDITSIGCHTGLWNFPQNHYHEWIYREAVNEKLAAIFPSDQLMPSQWQGQALLTGVGLHDSSAALIPYLFHFTEPFVLISTGTWCISLNPFNQTRLTYEELQQDCLCYMEYRGKPIKASRLFAGYEHELQTKRLAAHFNVAPDYYKTVAFNADLLADSNAAANAGADSKAGKSAMVQESAFGARDLHGFATYEAAYHQFMADLMTQQVASLNLVLHNSPVKKIFVDGGFGKNPLYMNLLANAFPKHEVYAASMAQASAIGAALAGHSAWNKVSPSSDLIVLKSYTGVFSS